MIKWVCIALVWIWIFSSFYNFFSSLLLPVLWLCSWPIQISLIFSRVHFKLMSFLSSPSVFYDWNLRFSLKSRLLRFITSFLFPQRKNPLLELLLAYFMTFRAFSLFFANDSGFNNIFNSDFHLNYLNLSLKSFFTGAQRDSVPYLAGTLLWTSILFWVGQFVLSSLRVLLYEFDIKAQNYKGRKEKRTLTHAFCHGRWKALWLCAKLSRSCACVVVSTFFLSRLFSEWL